MELSLGVTESRRTDAHMSLPQSKKQIQSKAAETLVLSSAFQEYPSLAMSVHR